MLKRNKVIAALTSLVITTSFFAAIPQDVNALDLDAYNSTEFGDLKTATDANGIKWKYKVKGDDTISLWGTSNPTKDMTVPAELDGKKVSRLSLLLDKDDANFNQNSEKISKVTVSEGIDELVDGSLDYKYLDEINLPNSIKYMTYKSVNEKWLEKHRDSKGLVIFNEMLLDGSHASGEIVISSKVTKIADYAFYKNVNITKVTISKTVINIGMYAFYGCTNLHEVIFNEGLRDIGIHAFENCDKINNVVLPYSMNSIFGHVFSDNTTVTTTNSATTTNGLVIKDGVLVSAEGASGDIVIPSYVTKIGDNAFKNNKNITSVRIHTNVTEIGESAFENSSITKVNIPSSVKVIKKSTFKSCVNLTSVTIAEGVQIIENSAFELCINLKIINIAKTIVKIEKNAFYGCSSLEKVELHEGLKYIGTHAFDDCDNLEDVALPNTLKVLGENAFNDGAVVSGSISTTTTENGLVIKDGVLISAEDAEGDIEIPSSVTKIDSYAFKDNKKITSVKISSSVTEIGESAFENSSITKVNIPGSVKVINESTFKSCVNLTSITISEGVQIIKKSAFTLCINITIINLPTTVIKIESNAFGGCTKLIECKFEANISIEADAFSNTTLDGKFVTRIDQLPYNGWFKDKNGLWYYFKEGIKCTSWIFDPSYNAWYYLNSDGSMKTGWFYDTNYNSWFYLNPDGSMRTGWLYDSSYGSWFYFNPSGYMQTGWIYDSSYGQWYYLYGNGTMAHDAWIGSYYVNSSGAWTATR